MSYKTEKNKYMRRRRTEKRRKTNGTQKRRRTDKRNKRMPQQPFERYFRYKIDQPVSRTEPMSRFYK